MSTRIVLLTFSFLCLGTASGVAIAQVTAEYDPVSADLAEIESADRTHEQSHNSTGSRNPSSVDRQPNLGSQYLKEAIRNFQNRNFFSSARYAFAAQQQNPALSGVSYAWVTRGLLHAGMPNAASYFFIRTLQMGNPAAIRSVLTQTQELLVAVGPDLLRKYLIRHTQYEYYDAKNRNAYLYALGKDALLSGDLNQAIGYFNGIQSRSSLWPYVLQLRATALAIVGKNEEAIADFRECASGASDIIGIRGSDSSRIRETEKEADDLKARCIAGEARTLYQSGRFEEADRTYDRVSRVSRKSMVWPEILFEQAWNAFARQEYNRTLGKLVSYKSPALSFVFNPEVEVLRAQAYLALCLYSDANDTIQAFNSSYASLGEEVKRLVERNANQLSVFHELGKAALRGPLHTRNGIHRLANRFVRSPYFEELVAAEAQVARERGLLQKFSASQNGGAGQMAMGFPAFVELVLGWRVKSIGNLGGAFVKNSLMDYHSELISDYEKTSFIKLEMLKRAKDQLMYHSSSPSSALERERGNAEPSRRNDQFKWGFNGEFWNDELGDYVFGLESECK